MGVDRREVDFSVSVQKANEGDGRLGKRGVDVAIASKACKTH